MAQRDPAGPGILGLVTQALRDGRDQGEVSHLIIKSYY